MTVNYVSLNCGDCEQKSGVKTDLLQETPQQRNMQLTTTKREADVDPHEAFKDKKSEAAGATAQKFF